MNTPKISIIMPVYNSGSYLKTAVDSILNQSFKEMNQIWNFGFVPLSELFRSSE